MRPGGFLGAAAGHDADVAAAHAEHLLVRAADPVHHPFRLARRRDVVGLGDHVQHVRPQLAQVHALAAEHQRALHQAVLLVELVDQLAVGAAGHRDDVAHPGVHGVPGLDHLGIVDVVPQVQVAADEVLDRLERLGPVVDHLARHVAERIDDPVGVERFAAGPADEAAGRLVGEVQRRRQQDQVLQAVVGPQCRVQRADQRPQAPAEHVELLRAGHRLDLADRARQVLQRVVVELEVLVLRARRAPVEQVEVVAVLAHVLDEAVAGRRSSTCGRFMIAKTRNSGSLCRFSAGEPRDVAVQLGLVERPDQLSSASGRSWRRSSPAA